MALPPPLRSASHPLARQVRALTRGPRERRAEGLFLVEGPRGLEEALAADAPLVFVLVGAARLDRPPHSELVARCLALGIPVQPVQDALLDRLVPAEHGPGLAATCRLLASADRPADVLAGQDDGLVVVPWMVQNPGNLGALLRSAAAFGARGLIAAGGADPWNPKAVRGAAGAIHRLAVARAEDASVVPALLAEQGFRVVAAVPRDGARPEDVDWRGRVALLLGGEVSGVPAALAQSAVQATIPTTGAVESLSVAVAGSILLQQAFSSRATRRAS